MNKLPLYFFLLSLISGCSIKTVNFSTQKYSLKGSLDCKCKYNETKKHRGPTAYNKPRLKQMARTAYVYAMMSVNAYASEPQINIPGWEKKESFKSSKGFGADVYLSTTNNEAIIAFRGTDGIFALNDHIFANFYINWFSGGQFSQADEIYKHVVYKYHPNKITTTGHSLGGGLALRISLLNKGVDAYIFDSSVRTGTGIGSKNIWGNTIVSIRDSGELLSLFRYSSLFKKIKGNGGDYRYNFLGGSAGDEHSMQRFAQCMYIAGVFSSEYDAGCK